GAGGVGVQPRGDTGERVPEGRGWLPLPDAGPRRGAQPRGAAVPLTAEASSTRPPAPAGGPARRTSRQASTDSTIEITPSTTCTSLKPRSWSAATIRTSRTTQTATFHPARAATGVTVPARARRQSATSTATTSTRKLTARPVRPSFSPVVRSASLQMLSMRVAHTKAVQATRARVARWRRMPAEGTATGCGPPTSAGSAADVCGLGPGGRPEVRRVHREDVAGRSRSGPHDVEGEEVRVHVGGQRARMTEGRDAADRVAGRRSHRVGVGAGDLRRAVGGEQRCLVEAVRAGDERDHGLVVDEEHEGLHDLVDGAPDGPGGVVRRAGALRELPDLDGQSGGPGGVPHALGVRVCRGHGGQLGATSSVPHIGALSPDRLRERVPTG